MDWNWMNWKTWTTIGLAIVAIFAIYTFAATNRPAATTPTPAPARPVQRAAVRPAAVPAVAPGLGAIHMEWLEMQSGTYKSERNLFAYKEPPPPPPPPPPQTP